MNEQQTDSAIAFPCQFPIKAMGKTSPMLDVVIVEIIRRHVGEIDPESITSRPSKNGKYTAVTITIEATNRKQLDAIYQDLTDHPEVIMAL
jgi:putative lipoic acid-binding regulatory protein